MINLNISGYDTSRKWACEKAEKGKRGWVRVEKNNVT